MLSAEELLLLNCGVQKTLESPLDCKDIQPVYPKGDQCWIFIGRTDVEAESPILWPPDAKTWLIWKDPDAGKDWRQEEKRTTGWDDWMASPTQWTWVWVNFGSSWWTERPGMRSERVGHDWVTELRWVLRTLIAPTSYGSTKSSMSLWRSIFPINFRNTACLLSSSHLYLLMMGFINWYNFLKGN